MKQTSTLFCLQQNLSIRKRRSKQILPFVRPGTLIVALQNGLGNIETIARLAGEEHTIGARVIFGVELIEPHHFKITAIADKVMLGAVSPAIPAERVAELAAMIDRTGIPTAATNEIDKYIWNKVLYNCCLNATAALLDTCYGTLGEFEATRNIIRAIITEVLAVAKSRGVDLGFPDTAAYEKFFLRGASAADLCPPSLDPARP